MKIINTGGTFNKRYDPIKGELFVPKDDSAVESIISVMNSDMMIEGILYKDSLDMNDEDRKCLCECIENTVDNTIVVVHGTDTMDLSAAAVAAMQLDKTVVFTGAMVPFAIDPVEATANLAMAIGYARQASAGVHIVMQGVMGDHRYVKKNKALGRFEHV